MLYEGLWTEIPLTNSKGQRCGNMQGDYDCYTDVGGRKENEDTLDVRMFGDNVVAVVADGLGGHGDGKSASQLVCDRLMRCGGDGIFPTRQTILDAFLRANSELISKQSNDFHMKTTAVYFCLQGNQAVWAHVGDSRLYHIYKNKMCDYTLDHSASQMAVFLGELKREDIPRDPGRSRLIRAMGVQDTEPDIREAVRLEPAGQHIFLLCSDGLWEYLNDEDIIEACKSSSNSKECIAKLRAVKTPRSGPDCDNNSAIVIYVRGW